MYRKKFMGLLLALFCCFTLASCGAESVTPPEPPENIQTEGRPKEEAPEPSVPPEPSNTPTTDDAPIVDTLTPPTAQPPKTEAPKDSPPKDSPPKVMPPVVTPPKTEPPVITPPIVEPPVVTPPKTEPPVVTPPVVEPPVVTPPKTEPPVTTPPVVTPPVEDSPKEESDLSIVIQIGTQSFATRLADNATARAFSQRLPLTLAMKDLNANEKFYYLEEGLTANSYAPGRIENGDLMLYGSDCLVLFYESFSSPYSYTKLGAVEDISGFKSALGSGSVTVTFSHG